MRCALALLAAMAGAALAFTASAHPAAGEARYLANEAVMISSGETKILFDPLFAETFGHYQQIPEAMRADMIAGRAPFDSVDAVLISHAHDDHFAAGEMAAYLARHGEVVLFAPAQAVEMIEALEPDPEIFDRVVAFDLERLDPAERIERAGLLVEAVRIPHAGWPGRADVQNLVLRVTLGEITVMHLGDADPDHAHFAPHAGHFQARETGLALPPYWFFTAAEGREIVATRLNAREAVGIHVPIVPPMDLVLSGASYFHRPGETLPIGEAAPQ